MGQAEPRVLLAGVDYARQFVQQVALMQSAAARCGFGGSDKTRDALGVALAGAEEALCALRYFGGPEPETLEAARNRSGLDGFKAAELALRLSELDLQAEAERFAAIASVVDADHAGISDAAALLRRDSTLAIERFCALVDDPRRCAKARLHAAWWLATFAHLELGHGRLVDLLEAALAEGDTTAADLAMRALQAFMQRKATDGRRRAQAAAIALSWPSEPCAARPRLREERRSAHRGERAWEGETAQAG